MQSTLNYVLAQIERGTFPWVVSVRRQRSLFTRSLPIVGVMLGGAVIGALGVMMIPATRRMDLPSEAKRLLRGPIRNLGRTVRKVLPEQIQERIEGNGGQEELASEHPSP